MNRFIRILSIIAVVFFFPNSAHAAKKIVRSTPAKTSITAYSKVTLNRSSHSAIVTFTNVSNVRSVEYTLSYAANGIPQGVVGSFNPNGGSPARDLYFGTCSKGVCTPHYGISNATLIIKTILKSGAIHTKRYRFPHV